MRQATPADWPAIHPFFSAIVEAGETHAATGSFMVDPRHAGRGVGRALGLHVMYRKL